MRKLIVIYDEFDPRFHTFFKALKSVAFIDDDSEIQIILSSFNDKYIRIRKIILDGEEINLG